MANETTEAKAPAEPTVPPNPAEVKVPITIPRNGVDVDYGFEKILKNKNKGTEYPCPNIKVLPWDKVQTWLGIDYIKDVIYSEMKAIHQKFLWDCTDEKTGEFNLAQFVQLCKDLTNAGLKIKVLERKIDELGEALSQRIADAIKNGTDFSNEEWKAETNRLNEEARGYRALLESKRREPKAGVEVDTEASIPS